MTDGEQLTLQAEPNGSSPFGPAMCCAALVAKIKDARARSHECWRAGYINENKHQRHYSAGQLDAFDAVLSWIAEAQHNEKLTDAGKETP